MTKTKEFKITNFARDKKIFKTNQKRTHESKTAERIDKTQIIIQNTTTLQVSEWYGQQCSLHYVPQAP